jgi:hypothetical protein
LSDSNGNSTSRGVQAYRWIMTIGMALLAALSIRVLDGVDKTAEAGSTRTPIG